MSHAITKVLSIIAGAFVLGQLPAFPQDMKMAATPEDREKAYTDAIENRTGAVLKDLALQDAAKAARVHDAIIAQYRALRARDESIDKQLKADAKASRPALFASLSKPLHESFLARLGTDLAPEQVEVVKDRMTYNKVKVTFDAYCAIVPGLTGKEKEKIREVLKEAREEAMDGGSAREKSDIFQKHKDRINEYLTAQGHDIAKAYRDWNARQEAERKLKEAATNAAPAVSNAPAK